MNVLEFFGAPSSGHDDIASSVSSDEESVFAFTEEEEESKTSSHAKSSVLYETDDYLSKIGTDYGLDDGILSQGTSSTGSSTGSSSGGFRERQPVVFGGRRQRADTVRAVFDDPLLWRCLDNFQVECCGGLQDQDIFPAMSVHRGDPWPMFESDLNKDTVAVAVEATAICELDLTLGRRNAEQDSDHSMYSHRVLGSNFVGIVHHSSPRAEEMGIKPGTRVASIVDGGSNARYVSITAEKLVKVPKHLDAADVACLISAYLPAFQALHHGRSGSRRFANNSLQGKKVLIVQGASPEAQALVRLARLAGATDIYLTASRDHLWHLEKHHGCKLLGEHPDDWLPAVEADMDLVVNYEFPKYFWETRMAMAPKGRLVCCVPIHSPNDDSWLTYAESVMGYLQLVTMKRATVFDFVENQELEHDRLREDLSFLLKLLTSRQLRPEIDRYIKLSEVPITYQHMKKKRLVGAVICEPWRE